VNYYGIVRPEQQLYNAVGQLQQQVATNQQSITGLQQDATAVVTTGHPIYFLNYQRYFLNLGAPPQTGLGRQPGTTTPTTTQPGQQAMSPMGASRSLRPSITRGRRF
jgi:hypothetical protein